MVVSAPVFFSSLSLSPLLSYFWAPHLSRTLYHPHCGAYWMLFYLMHLLIILFRFLEFKDCKVKNLVSLYCLPLVGYLLLFPVHILDDINHLSCCFVSVLRYVFSRNFSESWLITLIWQCFIIIPSVFAEHWASFLNSLLSRVLFWIVWSCSAAIWQTPILYFSSRSSCLNSIIIVYIISLSKLLWDFSVQHNIGHYIASIVAEWLEGKIYWETPFLRETPPPRNPDYRGTRVLARLSNTITGRWSPMNSNDVMMVSNLNGPN